MTRNIIPRLSVFGWAAMRGRRHAAVPCMLDLPNMRLSTSGRASILLALEALGVGRGDSVLLPSYHCPTMVAPTSGLSATPVFYPINASGEPDLAWLDRQDLSGVRAMLAAHYFGLPQPMAKIKRWCQERGIALIEDCAHALFGSSDGLPVGAWGDVAIGSLTKFFPVPEGGCIVFNRADVSIAPLRPCSRMHSLKAAIDILETGASHQALPGLNGAILGTLKVLRQLRGAASNSESAEASGTGEHLELGTNLTVDSALAHRGLTGPCRWVARLLPRDRVVRMRRQNFERLRTLLTGHRGLRPLLPALPDNCAPYVFPLWVDEPDPGYAQLRELMMPIFRWDRLWPGTPYLPGDQGQLWSHHVIQLTCHQDLTAFEIESLVDHLLRLYSRPLLQCVTNAALCH